jgi:hypothetical protein
MVKKAQATESAFAEVRALKKEFVKKSRKAIKKFFDEFFVKFPNVGAVQWEQYTPFWNDGESCTFSRGEFKVAPLSYDDNKEDDVAAIEDAQAAAKEPQVEQAEEEDEEDTDEWTFLDSYEIQEEVDREASENDPDVAHPEELLAALDYLEEQTNDTEEEFQESFGDHAQVTASRKGISVAAYEDHE